MFVSESTLFDYRRTAYKYGAVFLVLIVNYLFLSEIITSVLIFPGFNLIQALLGENSGDISYAFIIIMNAVIEYPVPILIFLLMFRSDMPDKHEVLPYRSDGDYRRIPGETAVLYVSGLWTAMMGNYITATISELLNKLFSVPEPQAAFSNLLPQNAPQFAALAFGTCIAAPLCEEYIFRHLLLRPLRKYGDLAAAVMSALLFGLFHFNFDQFMFTFSFGFFLAVIAVRSNSIIPCVICHMLNNITATFSATYMPETFGSESADAVFSALSDFFTVWGLIVFFGGFLALIAALLMKLLRFNSLSGMSGKTQLAVLFKNPAIIFGIISCLVIAFINLYA